MEIITFSLLAFFTITGAIGVVTLSQPVHAALALVFTLLTLAIIYVTLEAHFLAAIQVIVYAGAIMVLFLFVIMLLNVYEDRAQASLYWLPTATYITATIAVIALVVSTFRNSIPLPDTEVINNTLSGGGAAQVGEILFSDFILSFHLVGVLLLTGIIGAVSLVQRKAEAQNT